jgi:hypothetical protein
MKRLIIIFCLTPLIWAGCKENEIMDFGLPASVNFNQFQVVSGVEKLYFTKSYSFAIQGSSVTEAIVPIPVKLMGGLADRDRTFRAVAVAENTTAVEGTHYRILDGVIKADEYEGYLPVEVYRTEDTKTEPVSLQLLLVDTDDLKAGNGDAQMEQSADNVFSADNLIKFTLSWGDILMRPANWPYYWGAYYANKYQFAIDVLGQTDWPTYSRYDTDYIEGYYTTAQLQNLATQLNAAYQEYKLANGPIYNDDSAENKIEIYFAI